MKLRSRRLKILLLLIVLSFVGWIYSAYDRYREIHSFFSNPSDLAWAGKYLDKKINFCDSPWEETIVVNRGEQERFLSPSQRYEIKSNGKFNEDAHLSVVDTKTDRVTINVKTPFFSNYNFKWTKDERFLIFTTSITKDDWFPAKIFISNTSIGHTMYLGDSEFYECVLRHW